MFYKEESSLKNSLLLTINRLPSFLFGVTFGFYLTPEVWKIWVFSIKNLSKEYYLLYVEKCMIIDEHYEYLKMMILLSLSWTAHYSILIFFQLYLVMLPFLTLSLELDKNEKYVCCQIKDTRNYLVLLALILEISSDVYWEGVCVIQNLKLY